MLLVRSRHRNPAKRPQRGEYLPRAQMRILLDHSCVEVFLSTGEVLATRVYRGRPPLGADAGLDLVAFGGVARVERLEAWEMGAVMCSHT